MSKRKTKSTSTSALTVGQEYVNPRTVVFGNPGVVTVGEFPTWYDAIPNEIAWADEAYNDVKRKLSKSADEYLKQDVRTLFPVQDPVVRTLLEDQERDTERAIDEMWKEKSLEKRKRRLQLLLERGISEQRATNMLDTLEEEEAMGALRTGMMTPRRRVTFSEHDAIRHLTPPLAEGGEMVTPSDVFSTPSHLLATARTTAESASASASAVPLSLELEGSMREMRRNGGSYLNKTALQTLATHLGIPIQGLKKEQLRGAIKHVMNF